jgi:hypothetical protein
MLDAFEASLIDALADAVAGAPPVGQPRIGVLARAGAAIPPDSDVTVSATLLKADADAELGDDGEIAHRVQGEWRLRPEVWLTGELALALAAVDGSATERRRNLLRASDRLLLAMDPEAMRQGRALNGSALGFRLTALRFLRLQQAAEPADPTRLTLLYSWRGRFWPVADEVVGPPIRTPLSRIVVLPLTRPEMLRVRAGSGPASLQIHANLSVLRGAQALLLARIAGVAPGVLAGSGAPAPEGFVASTPDANGHFPLTYAPPAVADAPFSARVELRLGAGDRNLLLDSIAVEVVPA